jgi:hypothetical protein
MEEDIFGLHVSTKACDNIQTPVLPEVISSSLGDEDWPLNTFNIGGDRRLQQAGTIVPARAHNSQISIAH